VYASCHVTAHVVGACIHRAEVARERREAKEAAREEARAAKAAAKEAARAKREEQKRQVCDSHVVWARGFEYED
jgi:hypothetical protein